LLEGANENLISPRFGFNPRRSLEQKLGEASQGEVEEEEKEKGQEKEEEEEEEGG
jgi:hypothetical protein